jgi:hypothetical protein
MAVLQREQNSRYPAHNGLSFRAPFIYLDCIRMQDGLQDLCPAKILKAPDGTPVATAPHWVIRKSPFGLATTDGLFR